MVQNFKPENFDRFWLCPPKIWVNPNNMIANAHQEIKLPTEEHFNPLSAWNDLIIYSVEPPEKSPIKIEKYVRCTFQHIAVKPWCRLILLPAGCREAANCRYCFYSEAKNQVFRPAGATRWTDSGQTLQYRRAPGSAWLCKISRQSVQTGGNTAPKYQKFSLFGKESPRRGDSLDLFPKFLGAFIRLTILR